MCTVIVFVRCGTTEENGGRVWEFETILMSTMWTRCVCVSVRVRDASSCIHDLQRRDKDYPESSFSSKQIFHKMHIKFCFLQVSK